MEEILILLGALLLTFGLTVVKSLQLAPSTESEFELERRADGGDGHARHELNRRAALPLIAALQRIKGAIIITLLIGLLVATHEAWLGLLIGFGLLMVAELATARGWLTRLTWRLQRRIEPHMVQAVHGLAFVLRFWAPKAADMTDGPIIASKAELQQMIRQDQTVLTEAEKLRLSGALDFAHTTIAQAMVPRDAIVAVDVGETVGPLLLDRLHKAGHNIFPVVKNDIDHIKGLLYMADLVPLDPELKDVHDALRPTVHYLPAKAHLSAVLAASLQTGRQLFIVVDEAGKTEGLITLADTLRHLLGQPLGKDAPVTTKAK